MRDSDPLYGKPETAGSVRNVWPVALRTVARNSSVRHARVV
eukprot:COSAG06_NODE_48827_length_329_cov_0.895652_1_plen_40_part_01